ncbi:hypothetical protein [Peredibacter starrii]|uniref:Uncharacterized protein n=1 Tax=Peredibacter starrii TaxID=28202 RepID=A0AAX4HUN2_9BACT|nr:hypothetical protein [Peredibacter starrii]WPU66691.1 hypothetical protein SOO65_08025 [Peredibacter starrii]
MNNHQLSLLSTLIGSLLIKDDEEGKDINDREAPTVLPEPDET